MKFDKFAVITAIATMFDTNEEFDVKSQRKLVEFLIRKGIDGLYIGGSTGEGFMMGTEDRKKVIAETVSAAQGKTATIAYVGSIDTRTAVELAKHAEKEGVDAISSVPPYYYGFSGAEILNYYRTLTDSVGIPLIMYNNTNAGLMGINQIKEGLELPNCGGIKYTASNHFEMKMIKLMAGNKFVFSGADEMFGSAMLSNVDGAIGSTYNFAPEIFIKMRDAFINNNNEEFMRLSEASARVISSYINHSYMPAMKASLELLGLGKRVVKSPKFALSDNEFALLKNELKEIKKTYSLDFVELLNLI